MNKLTTTFKSWGLVQIQPTILFLKNTYTVLYCLIFLFRKYAKFISIITCLILVILFCYLLVIGIIIGIFFLNLKTKRYSLKPIKLFILKRIR